MEVRLRRATLEEIERHAVETYPEECCGIVVSARGDEQVRRITNVQDRLHALDRDKYPRNARTAYFMEPRELEAVLRESETPGCSIRLFYHSHPDHGAYFSAEDKAAATPFGEPSYPDAFYLVLSVVKGSVADRLVVSWDSAKRDYARVSLALD